MFIVLSFHHPNKTKKKIIAFPSFYEDDEYILFTKTLLAHARHCSKPFIIKLFKPYHNPLREVIALLFLFYKSGG